MITPTQRSPVNRQPIRDLTFNLPTCGKKSLVSLYFCLTAVRTVVFDWLQSQFVILPAYDQKISSRSVGKKFHSDTSITAPAGRPSTKFWVKACFLPETAILCTEIYSIGGQYRFEWSTTPNHPVHVSMNSYALISYNDMFYFFGGYWWIGERRIPITACCLTCPT